MVSSPSSDFASSYFALGFSFKIAVMRSSNMETPPSSAPHQTSLTSPQSNSPLLTSQPAMNPTNANSRTSRETESCESDSLFEAESPAVSRAAPNPIIDGGIDPTTRLTARILDHPRSLEELADRIEALKDDLNSEDPPKSQYLLVRDIPPRLFSEIANEYDLIKGVRATINHADKEILYKMPYSFHERIIRTFDDWIKEHLGPMGLRLSNDDFWLGGSGRSIGRICDKEPDTSFHPGVPPSPDAPTPWPSLVLEVGLSESLNQLRTDAQWWYSNSRYQTKIVVLISANANPHNAIIEIWTEVDNTRGGPRTRGRSGFFLGCTMSARLSDGVVSGDSLVISFQTLMRRPPLNHHETDLELSHSWFKRICR